MTYYGMLQLQHRGQEGAGLVVHTPQGFRVWKDVGLLEYAIPERRLKEIEKSCAALGHVRYSTVGAPTLENIQPFVTEFRGEPLAIAHNGSLVNFDGVKQKLKKEGAIFHSSTDTEIILHLIKQSGKRTPLKAIKYALERIEGSYSLLILTPHQLLAIRDPYGFRPLEYGKMMGIHLFASESAPFDLLGVKQKRSVDRGKIIRVTEEGVEEIELGKRKEERFCLFELIYFARSDSIVNDFNVASVRKEFGKLLARNAPADVDMVISVPDSSNITALSYAEALGLPFGFGLVRNHYVGRSFINPSLSATARDVRLKYNTIDAEVGGKRICVVDDSIVRGLTSKRLVDLLLEAGAKEVHLRIASPPLRFPCFYGIDIPSSEELIGAQFDDLAYNTRVERIRNYLGATSLAYIPLEEMLNVSYLKDRGFCTACFSGEYPIPVRGKVR